MRKVADDMEGKVCERFCEVGHAARIISVEKRKLEGWLDGGMLGGTFAQGRWLADIHDVCRLHARFIREGRLGSRFLLPECDGSKLCDGISDLNRRMLTDMHSPRRSKTEKKLVALMDEISVAATPGQRPERPRKAKRRHERRTPKIGGATARHKAWQEDKKETQAKNARSFESFQKHRTGRFGASVFRP